MLVLVGDLDTLVVAARLGWRDRLQVALRASSLDRELARGVSPETDVCLALRAQRLVRPTTRRQLARSLRRLLTEANRPRRVTPAILPGLSRQRIRAAAADIEAVADQLQRPAPVSCRGVALVCVLLGDGASPLHGGGTTRDLVERLRGAFDALEPLASW